MPVRIHCLFYQNILNIHRGNKQLCQASADMKARTPIGMVGILDKISSTLSGKGGVYECCLQCVMNILRRNAQEKMSHKENKIRLFNLI